MLLYTVIPKCINEESFLTWSRHPQSLGVALVVAAPWNEAFLADFCVEARIYACVFVIFWPTCSQSSERIKSSNPFESNEVCVLSLTHS